MRQRPNPVVGGPEGDTLTVEVEADTLRVTGLSKKAKWEPRDIEQVFNVSPDEVKYMKLNVQYNLNEMNLGQPSPSYALFLTPVSASDAAYEIRNTSAQD